jgi:hypothetical protein
LSGDCNGRKVIFVPSADVEIVPNIEHSNETTSACLVIARTEVRVKPGGDAPGDNNNEDIVEMAVITDDKFLTEEDDKFDKLRWRGFVFADETEFLRDLVFEANIEQPAELMVYDPRYIYLLRHMLGRKPYEEFECGTVKDVDICTEWE